MAFRAGLSPDEFDSLSPNKIWNAIEAHYENEQAEWERARAIAFTAGRFGGNSDPKKFPKSPEKFWPFPWDKSRKLSPKEILEQHRKMKAERLKLLNNKSDA